MPYRRRSGSDETVLKGLMKENNEIANQKSLGQYQEVIDFARDPLIHLFYAHIRAGLNAFAQENQRPEEALLKYKYMLRLGEAYIGTKYGVDFVKVRQDIAKETDDESERLLREVEKIAELLDRGTRNVEVVLYLTKQDVLDFYREQKEEMKAKEGEEGDTSDAN